MELRGQPIAMPRSENMISNLITESETLVWSKLMWIGSDDRFEVFNLGAIRRQWNSRLSIKVKLELHEPQLRYDQDHSYSNNVLIHEYSFRYGSSTQSIHILQSFSKRSHANNALA